MGYFTKPPCYNHENHTDCPRRYVGCKVSCEEWHKWLAIHDKEKEAERANRTKYSDALNFSAEQKKRVRSVRSIRNETKRARGIKQL